MFLPMFLRCSNTSINQLVVFLIWNYYLDFSKTETMKFKYVNNDNISLTFSFENFQYNIFTLSNFAGLQAAFSSSRN